MMEAMQLPISDAKGRLTELVRRAEAGQEVVLTRHGHAVARIIPERSIPNPQSRREVIATVRSRAGGKISEDPSASRSQDFLYDGEGLPK